MRDLQKITESTAAFKTGRHSGFDGLYVVRVRKKYNLSRERLSRIMGVSWMTVKRWETGEAVPTPHARCILALLNNGFTIPQYIRKEAGIDKPYQLKKHWRSARISLSDSVDTQIARTLSTRMKETVIKSDLSDAERAAVARRALGLYVDKIGTPSQPHPKEKN